MASPSSSSSFLCCGTAAALQRRSTLRSLLQRCNVAPRSGAAAATLHGAERLQHRSKLRSCCGAAARLHAMQRELLQRYNALWSSMLAAELLQRSSMA
ncbi:unnamed protein product [Sphagnum jensenii]|uniref:Uncharacterized protein n=1 Tax=Sphagnum jensenii TaxID=128206 RepID=A0ABP0WQN4_9BRYO